MVPPASRRPLASFGGAPPWGGFRRLQSAGSLLPWLLPSAFVHVVLIAFGLLTPVTRVQVGGPVPDWFVVLTVPVSDNTFFLNLPPPPTEPQAPVPDPARSVQVPRAPAAIAVPPELGPPVPPAVITPGEGVPSAPGPPSVPAPGSGERRRYTAAERLRPDHKDPRLWLLLPEEIVGLSDLQRAQLELDLAITAIADSMAVMAEAGRRATDWTYTDGQGRRWGVTPGQLHLGGITIPLPFGFAAPVSATSARRAWQDADIAGRAERATVAASLKDRAAEIRRRRDAERAEARSDTTVGR